MPFIGRSDVRVGVAFLFGNHRGGAGMTLDTGSVLTIGGLVAGGLIWLIRLEAAVKSVDQQRIADLASVRDARLSDSLLNTERFNNIRESLGSINDKLEGLEQMSRKVDQIRSFIGSGPGPFQGS